ncbi:MAG: phosphoenolpyruvate carboxykinase (ATP) [Planctomycetota bacterium]
MDLIQANLALRNLRSISRNLTVPQLYEQALARGEGQLAEGGAFVALTGRYTGRSAKDKYVVRDEQTEREVWWEGGAHRLERAAFDRLRARQAAYLNGREVYVRDCFAGADPSCRLKVRVIAEQAWHCLFAANMFRAGEAGDVGEVEDFVPDFTIVHTPGLQADPAVDGTRSEAFVALDFAQGLGAIGGTSYAGEIKKSIFTVLNYHLPARGVMAMHCSANVGASGESAVFFGLSGTGKTTLSADPARALIGDDEHGWSTEGVFNFEGGCYAKVIDLSPEAEPEIYATTRRFGTILENVVVRDDRSLDLADRRYTENTRACYPLGSIPNVVRGGRGGHPRDVIFLTCDAFGVLPPIARLTPEQAMYHFVSGYTAKVAGTERGVTEPQATFSACFGAPFMPRHPSVYARLLGEKLRAHGADCWLVNTGWSGGPHGVGKRISIQHSRAIVNAALDGRLRDAPVTPDPVFGFGVPAEVPGVPANVLQPRATWSDPAAYDRRRDTLAEMFRANFAAFADGTDAAIIAAGPRARARA